MDFTTFEDAAIAAKRAWDAGDYMEAARCFEQAGLLVGAKGRVRQEPDGSLIIIPAAE